MTEQPRPRTKAGRDMLSDLGVLWGMPAWRSYPWVRDILAIEAEAAAPDPASKATAKCPVCGSPAVIRLADNWQEQVEAGAAIPIVGCGNPWHYFLDREAAAPDPVASPPDADPNAVVWDEHVVAEFLHPLYWGDVPHQLEPGDGSDCNHCYDKNDALRSLLEGAVASPAPLDVERLARALIDSDLMPRYREYAMRVPTMDPSETVEHLAAVWAGWVAAAYEAEGQPVADPAALADQIVDEGRVSAFGPPGTTFTPERQAKGQPAGEEPA